MFQPQRQIPTTAPQQLPVSPPRVAPSFPRVTTPPIMMAPTAPPIKAEIPKRESINQPPPIQSDKRLHIIPPYTPTPTRVKQQQSQQTATNVPPLKQMTPHIIAPDIHLYPFCHQQHQQPEVISARYANATKHQSV